MFRRYSDVVLFEVCSLENVNFSEVAVVLEPVQRRLLLLEVVISAPFVFWKKK